MVKFPEFLVAVDTKRNRIFVIEKPHLIAVKIEGEWNYGMQISDKEIEEYYELVTDIQLAKKILKQAKEELKVE